MNSQSSIVILTGAGISAESGIKTFRDHNGLWENHRIEDVASIDGYRRNPDLVQSFYNLRRAQLKDSNIQPNAAHVALSKLEREWMGSVLIVTQNVDDLHERAGSRNLIHMHGELMKVRCERSGHQFVWADAVEADSKCDCCGLKGTLRPDIVWFGEMPIGMDQIFSALETCDLFAAIGTSGQVYPAAGFVHHVPSRARTIELNAERSAVSSYFREHVIGPATKTVPEFVDSLLASR